MKHERDVEELLQRFSPRPSPPGLKERTIQAAEQKIRERRLLTPGWRWIFATGLVFLPFPHWPIGEFLPSSRID